MASTPTRRPRRRRAATNAEVEVDLPTRRSVSPTTCARPLYAASRAVTSAAACGRQPCPSRRAKSASRRPDAPRAEHGRPGPRLADPLLFISPRCGCQLHALGYDVQLTEAAA
jgi:hypothetical protein